MLVGDSARCGPLRMDAHVRHLTAPTSAPEPARAGTLAHTWNLAALYAPSYRAASSIDPLYTWVGE